MKPLEPTVMINQVERLSKDFDVIIAACKRSIDVFSLDEVFSKIDSVYLVGCGDSYSASLSMKAAFTDFSGMLCSPMSSLEFLNFFSDKNANHLNSKTLIIAISASGKTELVLKAIEYSKESQAQVIGITSSSGSPLTKLIQNSIEIDLIENEPSPGIRTYQASMIGILVLSFYIGRARKKITNKEVNSLCSEILSLSSVIDKTNKLVKAKCNSLLDEMIKHKTLIIVGSGPNFGTARFCVGKIFEALGIFAVAQDIEEWWHAERFISDSEIPIIVLAPNGKYFSAANAMIAASNRLNKKTIVVTTLNQESSFTKTNKMITISSEIREELTPFIYHLFINYLASFMASKLNKKLFESNPPNFDTLIR